MLIDQFIQKIQAAEEQVRSELVSISEEAALNLKALVVNRIQSEGVGEYSERDLPAFFYLDNTGSARMDKTKSNRGKKFIEKAAKKRESINWADIRDAEGLQTEFVDLTFTGEMLRGLHIVGTNVQGARVTTILGGDRAEVIKKLEWNVDRYGPFLSPTTEERAKIVAIIKKRFNQRFTKILT